ncbi:MAG: glycosyltransferase family 39 protein [Dehalococcoidia bacterium]|jgi:hypothetical protein
MPHKKLKSTQIIAINNKSTIPADVNPQWVFLRKYWSWILVVLILLIVASTRIRLLQIPLERDEGEFAYMGQLMIQGIPPYLLAYNMKLPGIYAIYALVMTIFGQTITGIHIGLMLINIAAIILLFLLTRRIFDEVAAIVAAASYALLSLSPSVLGTSAHATQFIVPFVLGGTLLLLKALDSGKYWMIFTSGLLYGLAFIIKQHAVFFIAFAVIYLIVQLIKTQKTDWKGLAGRTGLLLFASALPLILSCIVLYAAGVFPSFLFWTFTYAHNYVSEQSLSDGLQNLINSPLMSMNPWGLLLGIAGIGFTAILWNVKAKSNWQFLASFLIFSFLSICPGLYFRPHYFVTMLPAISLLVGVAVSATMQYILFRNMPFSVQILAIFIFAAAIITPAYKFSWFFLKAKPFEASLMMYQYHPFPESIEIAEYIKNHTNKDDKIAVIGSEPQIYFYANRRSATGYIYVYGLMENQEYASKMQMEMIHEIEETHPKYAIYIYNPVSWFANKNLNMNMGMLKWASTFLGKYYRTVGIIDHYANGYVAFWENDLRQYKPNSCFKIVVMERIGGKESNLLNNG